MVNEGTIAGKPNLRKYHRKQSSELYHNNPRAQSQIRVRFAHQQKNTELRETRVDLYAFTFLDLVQRFFRIQLYGKRLKQIHTQEPFPHQIKESESPVLACKTSHYGPEKSSAGRCSS
jgi:hypothetical protein